MSENDDIVQVLQDIRRWVKLIGLEDAREKVHEAVLDEDDNTKRENKIIFYLTDGERGSANIAQYVSVSYDTVSRRRQEWAKFGLMEKPAANKPYRKLITLEEAGIDIPDIPELEED